MRLLGKLVLPLALLLGAPALSFAKEPPAIPADLGTYLTKAEPGSGWKIEDSKDFGIAKVWRLKLTSQVWQGITWTHDLLIVRPPDAPTGKMLLLNEGGSASEQKAMYAALLAGKIKAPVALLLGVPNQPLFDGKREDDLIAETFVRFLDSGDSSWPLLFPMVKSVVKAMDSLQEFGKQEWGGPVEKFIVGGGSKRGWTTWLTAANDPRVMAITPMVIDVLNMRDQLTHQQKSLGGPSEEISPYTKRGLVPIPDTPRANQLWSMVDPWTYRERFTMPKLIVLGNNDPYWSTDALNLYWDALPGEKYISYSPNAGHDLTERDAGGRKLSPDRAINNVSAFVRHQLTGKPLPKLAWKHGSRADGSLELTITADPAPREARLWYARSETRDFRKSRWESLPIKIKDGEPIIANGPKPDKGFIAYYADLGYQIDDLPQWLCTQLRVVGADGE
ncbi:PhoPQ-activated pathogenicity-related family protein [Luteolibacter flavescens]|uniref:PhoPQ-activated pathogenicity-related family protein n=1 Tax=Luteolibacter flavescens TaxID=1859460 RepID=A0ABT3FVI6_9BACT|nr:PhoPQ-activated pathogenicity-related family protein [Luteolibacter flavescens]MCW1887606.1 PhoPQ-activated pathogenicity-related family protein [Luteolibacter flavescens]